MSGSDRSLSRSGLVELILSGLFVLAVSSFGGEEPLVGSAARLLMWMPCLLWMSFIYRQDRLEPEPWGVVASVAILSGGMVAGVAIPLSDWLSGGQGVGWAAALTQATSVVFTMFFVVRYTAYATPEFDEPIDAVVYSTAAACGGALALNGHALDAAVGVMPAHGASMAVATTLMVIASSMPMAIGLAAYRFTHGSSGQLVAALGASCLTLLGLERLFDAVLSQGLQLQLGTALVGTFAASAVFVFAGHVVTGRLRQQALLEGTSYAHVGPPRSFEPVPWLAMALLLGVGWLGRPVATVAWVDVGLEGGDTVMRLPAAWSIQRATDRVTGQADPYREDAARLELSEGVAEGLDLDLVVLSMEERARQRGFGYTTARTETRSAFGDGEALWAWYGMAIPAVAGSSVPGTARGVHIVAPNQGLMLDVFVPASEFDEDALMDALTSWGVTP